MPRTLACVLCAGASMLLNACGGGGSPSASVPPSSRAPATVAVTIRIDDPTAAQTLRRRPAYLSPATQSITISVNGATPVAQNLTPAGGNCSTPSFGATPVCTLVANAPLGSDTFTFITYDAANGTGNKLSQNTVVQTIVSGQTNVVAVTLEGVPTGVVAYPYPGQANVVQQVAGYILMGLTPANFFVEATDADRNFIIGPGAPTLTVTSSSTNLKVATVANNPNEFVLTPQASPVTLTLNLNAAGVDGGTATGSVPLTLKAVPPANLPKPLYVFDGANSAIDVFPVGAVGSTPASQRLISSLLTPYNGAMAWGPNGSLYAIGNDDAGDLVVQYSAAQLAAGSGTPTVAIESYYYNLVHSITPDPKILLDIGSLAVDSKGDVFVIGSYNGTSSSLAVFEYPAGFTPTTHPTQIPSSPTGETQPNLVYVDSGDNLYVVNTPTDTPSSILVFSAANPSAAPTRIIGGSHAGFTSIGSIAVGADGTLTAMDSTTNDIYVFAPGAANNPGPEFVLQSGAQFFFPPITVDPNNNIYGYQLNIGIPNTYTLDAYPAGVSGVPSPLFTLTSSTTIGSPSYLLFGP